VALALVVGLVVFGLALALSFYWLVVAGFLSLFFVLVGIGKDC
jgi:hypothetical protein